MAVKHYYGFKSDKVKGNSLDRANWDALRSQTGECGFAFEQTRADYERACESREDYGRVAIRIVRLLDELGLRTRPLVSLGVGKGILEWHIKRQAPDLHVECSDYASEGMRLLQEFFPSCDGFFTFDMLRDGYDRFHPSTTLLLYRVSTEFNRSEWRNIVGRIRAAGIQNVIFVPTEVAGWKMKVAEMLSHWKALLLRRRQVFCGWMYGERELKSIFSDFDLIQRIPHGATALYAFRQSA